MDYDLVAKMHVKELKNYLKIRGMKILGNKNDLVARPFSAITAIEVEEDLKNKYQKKLTVDDRLIPDLFKISDGWLEEDERMKFWLMLLYRHIFNVLLHTAWQHLF